MNDKMFAKVIERIKQAGQTRRARMMSAREGRGLDWSKAQKVALHKLKPSIVPSPIFVAAAQKFGKSALHTPAAPLD